MSLHLLHAFAVCRVDVISVLCCLFSFLISVLCCLFSFHGGFGEKSSDKPVARETLVSAYVYSRLNYCTMQDCLID